MFCPEKSLHIAIYNVVYLALQKFPVYSNVQTGTYYIPKAPLHSYFQSGTFCSKEYTLFMVSLQMIECCMQTSPCI